MIKKELKQKTNSTTYNQLKQVLLGLKNDKTLAKNDLWNYFIIRYLAKQENISWKDKILPVIILFLETYFTKPSSYRKTQKLKNLKEYLEVFQEMEPKSYRQLLKQLKEKIKEQQN